MSKIQDFLCGFGLHDIDPEAILRRARAAARVGADPHRSGWPVECRNCEKIVFRNLPKGHL